MRAAQEFRDRLIAEQQSLIVTLRKLREQTALLTTERDKHRPFSHGMREHIIAETTNHHEVKKMEMKLKVVNTLLRA